MSAPRRAASMRSRSARSSTGRKARPTVWRSGPAQRSSTRMTSKEPMMKPMRSQAHDADAGPVTKAGYYLTTAIFYPSASPALHSLFEAIGADALARYRRLLGDETRFLTGMDEHSAQVEPLARQHETDPKTLVDEWAANWRQAFDQFDISYDRFIRTTDA